MQSNIDVQHYAILPQQLTIHQDRGSPIIAHRYTDQMHELGVTLSHSSPRVSNYNAFSEVQLRTQKYQPHYLGQLASTSHATTRCEDYFQWYNFSHHHSGLTGFTPVQVFTEEHLSVAIEKQHALDSRYALNQERFVKGPPLVAMPPERVEINPLTEQEFADGLSAEVNFPTLTRVRDKNNLTKN